VDLTYAHDLVPLRRAPSMDARLRGRVDKYIFYQRAKDRALLRRAADDYGSAFAILDSDGRWKPLSEPRSSRKWKVSRGHAWKVAARVEEAAGGAIGVDLDADVVVPIFPAEWRPRVRGRVARKVEASLTVEVRTVQAIAADVFEVRTPTRSQVEAVRRAARCLEKLDRARLVYVTADGSRARDRRRLGVRLLSDEEIGWAEFERRHPDREETECGQCGEPFLAKRWDAKYCSDACRQRAYRRRRRVRYR
jgi:hypothetical protein